MIVVLFDDTSKCSSTQLVNFEYFLIINLGGKRKRKRKSEIDRQSGLEAAVIWVTTKNGWQAKVRNR